MSCCGSKKEKIKKVTDKGIKKINSSSFPTKIFIFLGAIIIYPIFPFILLYLMFFKNE